MQFVQMQRRDFIRLLGAAASWPLAARAQQPPMPVVGFLSSGTQQSDVWRLVEFRRGLSETGYVEGRNVMRGGKMRGSSTTLGILVVASVTCNSVQAAPRQPACIEIMASCEQAGFVRGDAKAGDGLFIDCVIPIVRGTPQRPRASKPLPQIDPKLIADCK